MNWEMEGNLAVIKLNRMHVNVANHYSSYTWSGRLKIFVPMRLALLDIASIGEVLHACII
jgi:hypothetical protein